MTQSELDRAQWLRDAADRMEHDGSPVAALLMRADAEIILHPEQGFFPKERTDGPE